MTEPRREDPIRKPPRSHAPRMRSNDDPSRLDELDEAARVRRVDRPATREDERSIEQDCSYWIG